MTPSTRPPTSGRRRAADRARAASPPSGSASPAPQARYLGWSVLLLALGAMVRAIYLSQLSKTAFGGYIFGDSAYYIEQSRLPWTSLFGMPAFLSPLYPGVLKILSILEVSLPNGVRTVQMLAGLLAAWLIGRLAARLISPAAGVIALGVAALYPPLIFFEGEILPASLSVLLQVLSMLWVAEARADWVTAPRVARQRAVAAGVAGGGAALLAPPVILIPVALALWWSMGERGLSRRDLRGPGLLLAGVLLALAPTTLGTLVRAHAPVPLSTSGGVNLWIGNNPEATGTFHLAPADSLGGDTRSLEATMTARAGAASPAAASGVWTRRALSFMLHHPGQAATLWGKKLLLLGNHVEGASQTDFGYIRGLCRVLYIPLPFVALFAIGLSGVIWMRRGAESVGSRGARSLLAGTLAAAALSPVLVFVTARHRLPLVPALIVGAAACVVLIVSGLRERNSAVRRGRAVGAVLTAIVLAAIGFLPLGSARADRPRMLALEALGELGRGRPADAVALFEEAQKLAPDDPAMLANLGAAYQRNGELPLALSTLRRAAREAPDNPAIAMNLGRVYLRLSHPDSAATEFSRATEHGGGADAFRILAATERQQKHWDASARALRRLLAVNPHDQVSRSDLGAVLLQAGRTQEAIAELEAVTREGVLFPDPWMNLAGAYRGVGRIDDEMKALNRAAILAPGDRGVMLSLATARRALGDAPGAIAVLRAYLQRAGRDSLAQALLVRYRNGGT